jgi:hypothetical protein
MTARPTPAGSPRFASLFSIPPIRSASTTVIKKDTIFEIEDVGEGLWGTRRMKLDARRVAKDYLAEHLFFP